MLVCLARSWAFSIGDVIRCAVRKAARLAVYEEIMMSVKNHHMLAMMRVDTALQRRQEGAHEFICSLKTFEKAMKGCIANKKGVTVSLMCDGNDMFALFNILSFAATNGKPKVLLGFYASKPCLDYAVRRTPRKNLYTHVSSIEMEDTCTKFQQVCHHFLTGWTVIIAQQTDADTMFVFSGRYLCG